MNRVLRQFSYAPRPKPGQSFTSYIETCAAEHIPPLDILTLLYESGIIEENNRRALPAGYGTALTNEQISNMAFTLRLREERVREMLLTHYDGTVIDVSYVDTNDPTSLRLAALKNGVFISTRICPRCFKDQPYFRLIHRLPWMFLCTQHKVLLSHKCPKCDRAHGNVSMAKGSEPAYPGDIPNPTRCRNPPAKGNAGSGRAAEPCGQALGEIETFDVAAYSRVLSTQERIERVLECGKATVWGLYMGSLEYFAHLRSLMYLLDYGADVADLGDGLPPPAVDAATQHVYKRGDRGAEVHTRRVRSSTTYRTPEWMCAFLPTAVELLDLPDEDSLKEGLAPLIAQARRFRPKHFRALSGVFSFQGPLLKAFEAVLLPSASQRRRYGYVSSFSRHPHRPYDFKPDHVPQLLWEGLYRSDFADLFEDTDMGEPYSRLFISQDLIRLCGDYSWFETARELGVEARQGIKGRPGGSTKLYKLGRYETYLTRLHATAARLEDICRPFDFGSRRRRHAHLTEFSFDEWCIECEALGVNPGRAGGKHKWAAAPAWALLTGGHPRWAPMLQGFLSHEGPVQKFSRFTSKHYEQVLPVIRTLALARNDGDQLAGEVALETRDMT